MEAKWFSRTRLYWVKPIHGQGKLHSMKRLSIIGCGKLGKALARLWHDASAFTVTDLINQTTVAADASVQFVGTGNPLSTGEPLNPAELFLIATPDSLIEHCCETLVTSGLIKPGCTVFHCSGALPSSVLSSAQSMGASVASVHPVRSFANPQNVVKSFTGTYCAAEGDSVALEQLTTAFEAIGGQLFVIEPENKTQYHAANVIVCNYLNTLLDVGMKVFEGVGIERSLSTKLMAPLVRETLENILASDPARALTGPIARGDVSTVEKHLSALTTKNSEEALLYQQLGLMTLPLAKAQGNASEHSLALLEALLSNKTSLKPGLE